MSSPAAPQLPPNSFEDRRGTVIGVVIFCLLFSTCMVGLRFWTRKAIINQVGIDDWTMLLGLAVIYADGISIAHMTKYGLGKHVWVLDPTNIPLYFRDFYLSIVFYCAALLAIKMGFLFQYYRVLAVQHMRIVYLVAMVIVGGWALSQTLVGIFTCTPINGFWDKSIESKCIPNLPQWYINAAGNIITDIAVFCLPLPAIWKLNLAKPQKLLLLGIFSLGFFTVILSVIRIRYLQLFEDFSWENVESSLWSVGELTSAMTCACLPTFRPFISRYFPSLRDLVGRSKVTPNSNGGYGGKTDPESTLRSGGAHIKLSSGNGSQVELASPVSGKPRMHPYEVQYNRQVAEDNASETSDNTDLVLAPRRPGVGVHTSIGPAQADGGRGQNGFQNGVQVQREMYQTRS